MKTVIVGGVAGGATCAARLRRLDEQAEIIILERGDYVSFANCGMPYHVGGMIADRDDLLLQTPAGFRARLNIEVRLQHTVSAIDRVAKTVAVRRADGSTYAETYDVLVLTPGAEPRPVAIDGLAPARAYRLRTLGDMDGIIAAAQQARTFTVVGAGFIGLEVAENLHARGLQVQVIEAAPQVLAPLDVEMAALVQQELQRQGVQCHCGTTVTRAREERGRAVLTLSTGAELTTDAVLLAIGVMPETALARDAGLELGPTGGIAVDAHLRTSDAHIYAAGDAVEITNRVTGQPALIPLAGPANKQGRVIADNIAGRPTEYTGALGTAIAKIFDLGAGCTGLSERACRRAGIDCRTALIHANSHAGYYPGAEVLSIKLVYAPDGKLLGGQAVGKDGADKRLDVVAAYLAMGGTIADLVRFESSYAPPYGSARDAVNVAALVAENQLTGLLQGVSCTELAARVAAGARVLDVRTAGEFARGHIAGAMHIPVDDLRARLGELDPAAEYIVHCAVGQRSYLACRILMQHGFARVYNLAGGYYTHVAYRAAGNA